MTDYPTHARVPRAVVGSVRANAGFPRAIVSAHAAMAGRIHANAGGGGTPAAMMAELSQAIGEFKAHHKDEIANINAALGEYQKSIDELTTTVVALRTPNGSVQISGGPPPDPAYSRTFAGWARKGVGEHELDTANASGDRSLIRAAMSVGDNSQGGYLAPIEWDRKISKALTSTSPLRSLCTVITTTVGGYSTLWNSNGWGSGWVGETASRPVTATPNLAAIIFKAGEIYAQPAVTQQLLDDAAFDVEGWLANEVSDEFARQEAIAFVSGNGTNKPMGFLSYVGTGVTVHPGGEPAVTITGNANLLTGDGLVDLVHAVSAPYRGNGTFLMNSATLGSLRKVKDGQGNYLWQPSFIAGQPSTLLGYPVAVDETMPDVAPGAYPVAFGDWRRFYVINDRMGTRVLRDPYTNKPYVQFYTTKRVGGGVLDPKAVRLLKVAA